MWNDFFLWCAFTLHRMAPTVLSPTKELILFIAMVPNREWDFSKQLTDWGFIYHILKDKTHCPSWLVVNLPTNPGCFSPGFPYFLSSLSQSPYSFPCHHTQFDPRPGWQLPPSLWGHSQCCSVDSLAVGIWGQLLPEPSATAPAPYLTMALCSPWLSGWKTHPAQPRPPTKCITWGPQLKQDGGWLLEVTWPP